MEAKLKTLIKYSKCFFRILIALFLLALSLYSLKSNAAEITLTWQPSPSAEAAGYYLRYGETAGNYTSTVDVSKVTRFALNVLPGKTYFIAAQAYNADKSIESAFSNEVSISIPREVIASDKPLFGQVYTGKTYKITPIRVAGATQYRYYLDGSLTPVVTRLAHSIVYVTYPTTGAKQIRIEVTTTTSVINYTASLLVE